MTQINITSQEIESQFDAALNTLRNAYKQQVCFKALI